MNIKALFISLVVLVTMYTHNVVAHPGGHGPVSEETAHMIATDIVNQFTRQDPGLGFGTLSNSWNELPGEAKITHRKTDGYYIIALRNNKEGKTLYVLMSIAGEVYDASFSGEFPGLKQ